MARRRRKHPGSPAAAPPDPAAIATERRERIREFVTLADQILRNPAVLSGIQTELSYVVSEPPAPAGTGTWSFAGPNDYLVRALLLDVRNVTAAGSALEIKRVLRALAVEAAGDSEIVEASRRIRAMYASFATEGVTTEDGTRVKPATIVALWLNAVYHHRDLDKLCQLRALHPFQRIVHQTELYEWLRNVCCEAVFQARMLIDVAVSRGNLADIRITAWAPLPQDPPLERVALRALLALVAEKGGTVSLTREDIDRAAEPYGGLERVQLRLDATGQAEVDQLTLTLSRGAAPGLQDRRA